MKHRDGSFGGELKNEIFMDLGGESSSDRFRVKESSKSGGGGVRKRI